MDSTTGISGGRHRRDIVHNPFFIYMVTKDPNAFKAAMIHMMIDSMVTDTKKRTKNGVAKAFLNSL